MNHVDSGRAAWERLRALPPGVLDAAFATLFVVAGFLSTAGEGSDPNVVYEPRSGVAYALILATTLPLFVRRRAPLAVFCVTGVAISLYVLQGFNEGILPLVILLGAYTVGAYCPPRSIALGAVFLAALLLTLLVGEAPGFGVGDAVGNAGLFSAGGMFGWTMQTRRLRLEALEQRAEALEREQEQEAQRAVADERLRIAQELHDVVAHSMSVIAVQAGAGMHVVDRDPAAAKTALENISKTSRSTLTELRRLLGVLREDEGGPNYAPAPGLADLPRLARDVTDAGVPVEVVMESDVAEVPPGVDFTGYRIVQEALTNVLKHAGPARASVHVDAAGGALHIEVTDDGRGVNGRSDGTGHGLTGMRERVAVYGGSLAAGPRTGGGFRVVAAIPYASFAEVEEA